MIINAIELLEVVIKPTLEKLGVNDESMALLLLGTAACESHFNCSLRAEPPAEHEGIGLYRISHESHWDVWDKFLAFQPEMASTIRGLASQHSFLENPDRELGLNINYATAIAWSIYKKAGLFMPKNPTITQLATCWCRYYRQNRNAIPFEFIDTFNTYVSGSCSRVA